MMRSGWLIPVGAALAYVFGVIAVLTIMPPLDTWAALAAVGGFVAVAAFVVAFGSEGLGVALWVVATALWLAADFTYPRADVSTAGHWGYAACIVLLSGVFGALLLSLAGDNWE